MSTALLVEDDLNNQTLIALYLESLGYQTITFQAADDAMIYLSKHSTEIDLVVMDRHTLGRLDGLEAMNTILYHHYPELPALLCSNEARDFKHMLKQNGYGCLPKLDMSPETLAHAIEDARAGISKRLIA